MATQDTCGPYGTGRVTSPRRTIATVADAQPGAFTVEELAMCVRETDPSASATATVYRAVAAMEKSGHLARVGARGGHVLYARCDSPHDHHHHVVCDGCGRIAPARCPLVSTEIAADTSGFTITRHEVTLYGLCPACSEARSRKG